MSSVKAMLAAFMSIFSHGIPGVPGDISVNKQGGDLWRRRRKKKGGHGSLGGIIRTSHVASRRYGNLTGKRY